MNSHLEEAIVKSGLKKGYLAKELNVTPQQFSKWIKGKIYPPADKLFHLAYLLNCSVYDLYTWDKEVK